MFLDLTIRFESFNARTWLDWYPDMSIHERIRFLLNDRMQIDHDPASVLSNDLNDLRKIFGDQSEFLSTKPHHKESPWPAGDDQYTTLVTIQLMRELCHEIENDVKLRELMDAVNISEIKYILAWIHFLKTQRTHML